MWKTTITAYSTSDLSPKHQTSEISLKTSDLMLKHKKWQHCRLPNIGLAPGSQKKINQLLLHCCVTTFIVTKETLLKLLTTFLKKQSPNHAHVIFDRSGLVGRCMKYSVSQSSNKKIPIAAKTLSQVRKRQGI